jgi:hypothetical protein
MFKGLGKYGVLIAAVTAMLAGCGSQKTYLLSPFTATGHAYRTIPLQSDSVKAASYVSAHLAAGAANQWWEDGISVFSVRFHRSHNLGAVQGYYGAQLLAGNYHVSGRHSTDFATYKVSSGNKFFGGYGIQAGINGVIKMGRRHEWRLLGFETSLTQEWGDYYRFRKQIPDSAVNVVDRNNFYATAGLTTEFLFKLKRSGNVIGYKIAGGPAFRRLKRRDDFRDNYHLVPGYFSMTLHFTKKRFTGFGQLNMGSFNGNFQTGINYRL